MLQTIPPPFDVDRRALLHDTTRVLVGVDKLIAEVDALLVCPTSTGSRRLLPRPTRPFNSAYELGELLGSGSFADVWTCKEKRQEGDADGIAGGSGMELACKTVFKKSLNSEEKWENVRREVVLLSALSGKHKGLLFLKEVLESDRSLHIVMELCRGGDLYELLSANGRLPERACRMVMRQVVSALCFCHANGIIHRDIKPENIIFDAPALGLYKMTTGDAEVPLVQAKLADFGLSLALEPGQKAEGTVGSRWYTAPELVLGRPYGRRIDVWSLGVVLCTMLSGKLPFAGRTHSDDEGLKRSILRGRVNFKQPSWHGVSEEAKDVIGRMVQVEPSQRITAFELLKHPWVAGAPM